MTADDTVTARLAEWEALVDGATEGPWAFEPAGDFECGEPGCCHEYWDNRIWGDGAVLVEGHMLSDEDAEFIAHAREMVPALLGFVQEVLNECDRLGARNYVGESGSPSDYMSAGERVVIDRVRNLAQKWLGGDA